VRENCVCKLLNVYWYRACVCNARDFPNKTALQYATELAGKGPSRKTGDANCWQRTRDVLRWLHKGALVYDRNAWYV
jgi:hypothetical protein